MYSFDSHTCAVDGLGLWARHWVAYSSDLAPDLVANKNRDTDVMGGKMLCFVSVF